MKLKRLLSGVTAAIMALSSVAVASFTSASADDISIKAKLSFSGAGWKNSVWGDDETANATITGDGEYTQTLNLKEAVTGINVLLVEFGDAYKNYPTMKATLKTLKIDDKEVTFDASKARWEDNATAGGNTPNDWRLTVCNQKDINDAIAGSTTPVNSKVEITYTVSGLSGEVDPNPTPGNNLTLRLIDNNGAQLGTQKVTVDKDGQYEITAENISLSSQSAITLRSTEAVKGTVTDENATITVDEVTVNGIGVDVPSKLKDAAAYGWDAPNDIKVDIYNAWNAAESIKLPAGASTITSIKVKFTLKNTIKKQEPAPGPGGNTLVAAPYFQDGQVYIVADHTPEVTIDHDGQYSVTIPAVDKEGNKADVAGTKVLVIDFLDALKKAPNLKAKLDKVEADGVEVAIDASKTRFGNLEDNNDHLRLELYNSYVPEETATALDPDALFFKEGLKITFTVSDLNKKSEPTKPSGNNVTTPTPGKTTKTPAKTTRNPKQVAKDKAAAQKAMRQAKLNTLKVKSKAKKKINVTWKKVKKAKGYQVQVSTNKKFKKSKIIFKKDLKKTKLTIKNKKIKSKKTYFVRVRAYATYKDKNGKAIKVYSKWNKKLRKVKVK